MIFALGATIASWHVAVSIEQLRSLVGLHEVEELRRNLVISVQMLQADLYTAHTPLARTPDAIVAGLADLRDAADVCTGCHHRSGVENRLTKIQGLIEEYQGALSAYITASANRERMDRLELDAAFIGKQLLLRTTELSATASVRLEEIGEKAAARAQNVRVILLATLVITTGLGIVVSSSLVHSVTGPVGRLVSATRSIASGNLGLQIDEERDVEFAELARNFNVMSAAVAESHAELMLARAELHREISERGQTEEEREELAKQLLHAQTMEAVGGLSTAIAREFGNLLQVIQGCVDRLTLSTHVQAPERQEVDMIASGVQRGAEIIRRLVGFGSQVESRPVAIDVNERVRNVKRILDRAFPKSIEVDISLSDDLHTVEADAAQIEQALMNIALNARDAMPDGGLLHIETTPGGTDDRSIRRPLADEVREWVLLRISDTGHGMDDKTVQQIFDPFFTTKEVGLGTGLGLAMVYDIVTRPGGRIGCQSEVGRGTVFELRLPAMRDGPMSDEAEGEPTQSV
jgi:signal transduction histidine kinase